ncbi:MAG: hypothetical protein JWQ19_3402 [Subtercola sp.]|nr:hypothetical protein [Subtercola sp.]
MCPVVFILAPLIFAARSSRFRTRVFDAALQRDSTGERMIELRILAGVRPRHRHDLQLGARAQRAGVVSGRSGPAW